MNKCKLFNHKWLPVYIKGDYNGKTIKFIGCYCERCFKGHKEILEIDKVATNHKYGTYNEKYFNDDNLTVK